MRTDQPSVEHHTVERDGWRWHVVTAGPADAPPVLLLHCWTGNWTLWQPIMARLDGQYRFITPDHLGFGGSDKPVGDHYRIDDQAERTLFLLRHFGHERARVVGHSMGGQIALTLAGTCPEAVERLAVIDPAVTGRLHPLTGLGLALMALVRRGIEWPLHLTLRLGLAIPRVGALAMATYFPRPWQRLGDAIYWAGQMTADGQTQSAAWAQRATSEWDVSPLLSRIAAPTLAIWGEQDWNVPISELDVLAAGIRDFRAVRIPRVGHFPMIEAFEQTVETLDGFLRGG